MANDLQIPTIELLDSSVAKGPTPSRRSSSELIELLTATAGFVALVASDAAPTGLAIADGLYRGAFAALVVWFASRARRWTHGFLSGVAVMTASSLLVQALAVLGVAIFLLGLYAGRRKSSQGALIALLCLPALLTQGVGPFFALTAGRISDPFGTSAVITAVAVVPMFRTGWQTISRKRRRTTRRWLSRVAIGAATVAAISGLICLLAVPALGRGLENTQRGAQAASEGNLVAAMSQLEQATMDWSNANQILSGPWMLPARLLPVAGQNLRAGQVATGQASALTDSAATVVDRVDPSLLVVDGAVNIAELDRITPAFDALAATVTRAEERVGAIDTPWLLSPIAERVERTNEVLAPSAGVLSASAEALHVGRTLLGASEPQDILIMFTTPAEARGSGGFVGSWVLAEASEGQLDIERSFRSVELNNLLEQRGASLNADPEFTQRYAQFDIASHIQDVTISPHFPAVGAVAADLFEQATDVEVDAVVSVDPFVLQKLIGFTGPIRAGDRSLTGANAAEELLVNQYVAFDSDEAAREAALLTLTDQLTAELFGQPPDPIAFVSELAPLADQNRINLWLRSDPDGEVTGQLGLSGAFPESTDDLLAVIHQNGGQNKIDSFLERSLAIDTVLDPDTRSVRHDLSVNLVNTAPASGLPDAILASNDQGLPLGTNRMTLSTYAQHSVVEARLNGEPVPVATDTEFGLGVHSVVLELAPGEAATLQLTLEGEMANADTYEVTLGSQPLVSPDRVDWQVTTADGSRIEGPSGWSSQLNELRFTGGIDRDRTLRFVLPD